MSPPTPSLHNDFRCLDYVINYRLSAVTAGSSLSHGYGRFMHVAARPGLQVSGSAHSGLRRLGYGDWTAESWLRYGDLAIPAGRRLTLVERVDDQADCG